MILAVDLDDGREVRGGGLRWAVAFVLVAGLHGAAGAALMAGGPVTPAVDAPEAMVLVDLPPAPAPVAESVESVASAGAAEADAEAPPPEPVPVETGPPEPGPAEQPAPEPIPPEPAPPEPPPARPDAVAEVALPDETVAPVPPDVRPPRKPVIAERTTAAPEPERTAARKPRPEREAAEAPRRPTREAPAKAAPAESAKAASAPAREAVAGERASGAGQPDPNALAGYSAKVRARIMRQRKSVSASAHRDATVTVRFTVLAGGNVSGVSVARSSGDAGLDAAAVRMVERASPLPAIPPAVGRSSLTMNLPVRFDR